MKLNDFNKKLKEEYNSNLDLEPKLELKAKSKKKFIFIPLISVAAVIVAIFIAFASNALYVNNYNKMANEKNRDNFSKGTELVKINNYDEIKQDKLKYNLPMVAWIDSFDDIGMKTAKGESNFPDFQYDAEAPIETTPTSMPSDPTNEYNTNVRESGVDEADIAKCDGKYIYYLSRTNSRNAVTLVIYDLEGNKLVSKNIINSYENTNLFPYSMRYIYGNGILNYNLFVCDDIIVIETNSFVKMFKLEDNELTTTYETTFEYLVDSRLIGDYYYFYASCKYSKDLEYVDYDNCYYNGYSMFNRSYRLYKYNLKTNDIKAVDLIDSGSINLYMNNDYIVIASIVYGMEYYSSITAYTIFDIDLNPIVVFKTCGNILNTFSMDIKDGKFRVVVTKNRFIQDSELNALYIYDIKEKELIGSLEKGLGIGRETVKSVRFDGDKCYVVTFLQTDPLYEIDLSDPTNPKIVDEYHAPGYSSYLHPVEINDEKYLIGLGEDLNCYKLSLYKDLDENIQVGKDFYFLGDFNATEYKSFRIFVNNDKIYFGTTFYYYHSNGFNLSKFRDISTDVNTENDYEYRYYEIDPTSGEVALYKQYEVESNTRSFIINSKIYIPTLENLIIDTF
ncbi:MAG: beta-propeller domain-containing protein [Acholeplasmatales bacterium]|nr:beta-propeller domain-containing protein [Acholeplasmatales bacterium]